MKQKNGMQMQINRGFSPKAALYLINRSTIEVVPKFWQPWNWRRQTELIEHSTDKCKYWTILENERHLN